MRPFAVRRCVCVCFSCCLAKANRLQDMYTNALRRSHFVIIVPIHICSPFLSFFAGIFVNGNLSAAATAATSVTAVVEEWKSGKNVWIHYYLLCNSCCICFSAPPFFRTFFGSRAHFVFSIVFLLSHLLSWSVCWLLFATLSRRISRCLYL